MVHQSTQSIEGPDITNYWQYFNLDRDPFAMSHEDTLTYLPAYWEEMLDLIQYLVHYKNQVGVVTGQNGIGKSILSDLLIAQLGENVHLAKISAEPNLNVTRLIEFLSDAFLVPWQPEQSIEQALDSQLQAFQHKEKSSLLLIDNAHLLPSETLEALLYLVSQQSENQMRFHVLLFGEPVLQQTLQRMLEPAEESLVHFLTLEALSLEETQQYLNHRLSAAGWQNENPMSEEIVARVYRLSEGNPARINRIARRFLLDMLNGGEEDKEVSWFRKHLTKILGACLIVAILGVLGIWIWRMNNNVVPGTTVPTQPTISVNGQPLAVAKDMQTLTLPEPKIAPAPVVPTPQVVANTTPATVLPVAEKNMLTKSTEKSLAVVSAPSAGDNHVQVAALAPQAPAAVTTTDTAATKVTVPPVSPAVVPSEEPAAPAPVAKQVPAAPAVPAEEPAPVAKHVSAAATSMTTAATPATVSKKKTIKRALKKPAPVVSSAKSDTNKTAMTSTSKDEYAIQLIGLSDHAALEKFIQDNQLEGKVRTMKVQHNGKEMTVILYGRYKTMHEAEQGIPNLPPALINAGPWPRKVPK